MIHEFNYPQRIMALHSMLKYCGHEHAAPDYRWPGLRREEFILWQHTLSGLGRLRYQDREYELTAGTSMLLHMPHDHLYYRPPESPGWEFLFAILNGREVIRIARELERRQGPVHSLGQDSQAAALLRRTVADAADGRIGGQFQLSGRAYLLITSLAAEIADADAMADCPPAIRRALDLLLNSPGDPPDVAAMAEAAGLSRWHFSREFTRVTGMAPGAYIRDHLMRRAESWLAGGRPVKEVAGRCGFATAGSFIRAFRRAYGYSPGKLKD